jgi:hypothetical protein
MIKKPLTSENIIKALEEAKEALMQPRAFQCWYDGREFNSIEDLEEFTRNHYL